MNPPFGTRKKGADMEFLSAAMKVNNRKEYLFLLFSNFVSLGYMFTFDVWLRRSPQRQFIPCIRHLPEK
jgi:predicted RNA methylase